MITLKWLPFPTANVASYNVYRSIIGFVAPIAGLNGLTLMVSVNGGSTQTFTFDSGSPVDLINATVINAQAYLSYSGTDFIFRSNLREAPGSVSIIGGTALTALGLTVRVITEKSENLLIDNIAANVSPTVLIEYDDNDGALQDWYAITTIDSIAQESALSDYRQPITSTGPLCVIEGLVTDLQGVRISDACVEATVQDPPAKSPAHTSITTNTITVYTGPDGRFSLPLLQGVIVKLEVPSVKFSHMIKVPQLQYVFLNELLVDLEYTYPIGYNAQGSGRG